MDQRRGPKRGASQRSNPPQYDVASGNTWRPNPTLEPEQAIKLYRAMRATNTSASAVINELLAQMTVDEDTGLPTWAMPTTTTQRALIDLSADRPTSRAA